MAIMDFFRAPAAPQAPAVQAPAAAPATNAPSGNHSNTATPNLPVDPLDAYTKMYDNSNKATPDVAPSFALDKDTVGKVSSSLDFTKDIPPELMAKALEGDMQALITMMNHVGRGSYQTALQHQSLLTDKFVGSRLDFEGKQFGSRVKSELTSSALSALPNVSHPVLKSELNRVAKLMAAEHPDASPADIANKAQQYLMELNTAMNPAKAKEGSEGKEFDWSGYLTTPP